MTLKVLCLILFNSNIIINTIASNNCIGNNDTNSNIPETLSNIGYLNSNKYPITKLYVAKKEKYST